MMTQKEICEELRISRQTLFNWSAEGMPRHEVSRAERIGSHMHSATKWLYDEIEIIEWLREQE